MTTYDLINWFLFPKNTHNTHEQIDASKNKSESISKHIYFKCV